jgi:serine/threonine protein kinase
LDKFIYDLQKSLKFLENIKIVHGDINPDNILYDKSTNKYCLIDFGEATFQGY